MGTPITKAATVICDQQGEVDLSAISSSIWVNGNDVVDKADVELTKAPIKGCKGHPPGEGPPCKFIKQWTISLTSLQDMGQPVVGTAAPPTPVAISDVPIAVITCPDPGNDKLFAN